MDIMAILLLILGLLAHNSSIMCAAQPNQSKHTPIQIINKHLIKIKLFSLQQLHTDMNSSSKWGNSFSYWRAINREIMALQKAEEVEDSVEKDFADLIEYFQEILSSLAIKMIKKPDLKSSIEIKVCKEPDLEYGLTQIIPTLYGRILGQYERIVRLLAAFGTMKPTIENEFKELKKTIENEPEALNQAIKKYFEPSKEKHQEIIKISDAFEREHTKQEKIKAELASSKVPVKGAKNKPTNLKEKPKSNKEQLKPLSAKPKPSARKRQGTSSIAQTNSAKKRFQQRTCYVQSCPNL